jgi:hypothetical protein
MAALSDASVGFGVESVFGTPVTVTRWYEFTDTDLDVNKNVQQGKGLRVGSVVDRSGRRVVTTADAAGSVTAELTTKGFGILWDAILGTTTSTLVGGTTYQQVFTPAVGTTLPLRTIQTGVPTDAGTILPTTYTSATCESWEFELGNDGICTLKTAWDAKDWSTATAYTAPSYVAAPVNLFHFGLSATSGMTIGGVVVVPTTTALATGGTAVTNVRSFKLSGANTIAKDRFNMGMAGRKARQVVGDRKITGELEVELTDATVRDAFLGDTDAAITMTLTSTETLSTGVAQFQIVIPVARFNGEIPKPNGDGLITLKASFDVLDGLVASAPLYVVHRTADAAI